MEVAPLYNDLAGGPEHGYALWTRTADDKRLRVALWPCPEAKGTVLLMPGRGEYIEKYGLIATEMAARGYATVCVDWRSQGLSDRLTGDPTMGHIKRFTDYQVDLAAVIELARAEGLPKPHFVLAHSMGGTIGLRALYGDFELRAAAFSAPMWGLLLPGIQAPLTKLIPPVAIALGLGHLRVPGTNNRSYVSKVDFPDNVLTTDPDMFALMKRQTVSHPDLGIGGPSLQWLHAARTECRDLLKMPPPPQPAITFLGTRERVVSPDAMHQRMYGWHNGRLETVDHAEHEIVMETPAIRTRFFDAAARLFDSVA